MADGGFVGWLVHASPDVSVNLIAAAIGGTLVWSATIARRHLRLLRARKFWRTMAGRKVHIAFGVPDREPLRAWEKSGMVGTGDTMALVEIQSQLRGLGLTGSIVQADQLRDLEANLILIGGPDGNSVTRTMLKKLSGSLSYEFAEDPDHNAAAVLDKRSGATRAPEYDETGEPANDYGLIIRAANPLAPDRSQIVIVAGVWGYGTVAAAEKLGDRNLLLGRKRRSRNFEILVETTVVDRSTYNTKIVETREIARNRRNGHESGSR